MGRVTNGPYGLSLAHGMYADDSAYNNSVRTVTDRLPAEELVLHSAGDVQR